MQWQVTREPALKAQIKCLQKLVTYQLIEWRNSGAIRWNLLTKGPIAMENDKGGDISSYSFDPLAYVGRTSSL